MCDSTLTTVSNRLAAKGEELVVHRFRKGSVGLASAFDLRLYQQLRSCEPQGFSAKLKELFKPPLDPIPAVTIPSGSRLLIRDIPEPLQRQWGVPTSVGEALFTRSTIKEQAYRDAVRFQNGVVVMIQNLLEGQRVRVLSVSAEEEQQTEPDCGFTMRVEA